MDEKNDEMEKAKMAAAEIAFYLHHDFDDDTCTLASLQSDISKISLKSSAQSKPRAQKPGAYWMINNSNQAAHEEEQVAEDGEFSNDSDGNELVETPRRRSRLSAPQPAEPQDDGGSSRRETISEARRTCRKVERLLEGAFDALDPNLPHARIPEESTVPIAALATPPATAAAASVQVVEKVECMKKAEPIHPRPPPKMSSIVSNASSDGASTVAAAMPTELERRDAVNRPRVPDTPGAFAIQGTNAAQATVLEVEDVVEEEDSDDEDEWNELDRILDVDEEEWNRLDKPNELKAHVLESNLVVAARLASDVEANLHDKVRQSIMQQTPRAAVVHVEHGGSKRTTEFEDPIAEARRKAELERYKPRNVKEKLFGDGKTAMLDIGAAPDDYIRKRDTLPFIVKQNTTTKDWVASVPTSQKAWENSQRGDTTANANLELVRSIKTFPAASETEAYEAGLAMAPPVMESLDENPICCLCKTKFAIFRRPHHCKNCGVVVCSSCACSWSARRVPSTFNIAKKEKVIVCQACDWLADNFQKAVMKGDLERAKSLYSTGNVNLRHPYGAWRKGGEEVFNPIHMGILGGNLELVQWLISDKCCPLRRRDKANSLLCTSKGRSPIRLALTHKNPEILRFLVAEQGLSLMDEDLRGDYQHLLAHLTSLLEAVPDSMLKPVDDKSEHSISIDLDKLNASLPHFQRAATEEAKSLVKKKPQNRRGSF